MIKSTDPFPQQAEDFDPYLMQAFDQVENLPLHRHTDAVNPFEKLEDPAQGRPLGRLVHLVQHRLVVSHEGLAQSTLRDRIDQEGERHHRQQPLNPGGFLHKQRRDKAQRIFEKPKAPFKIYLLMPLYAQVLWLPLR